MKNYGDLEKYLSSKYVKDAGDKDGNPVTMRSITKESEAALNGYMDAVSLFNKTMLTVQQGLNGRKQGHTT